nr:MAG TPA_asm: hypothetical protein [Caudoviricetes sp.]
MTEFKNGLILSKNIKKNNLYLFRFFVAVWGLCVSRWTFTGFSRLLGIFNF